MVKYIGKDCEPLFHFPDEYKQNFNKRYNAFFNEASIMEDYSRGRIDDTDVKICEILLTHTFATARQIKELLGDAKLTHDEDIETRLAYLFSKKLINSFSLAEFDTGEKIEGALYFYCLDMGGKILLTNTSRLDTTDWNYMRRNIKAASKIAELLIATEWHIKANRIFGERITEFVVRPHFTGAKFEVFPTVCFTVDFSGLKKNFVIEVVRKNDLALNFRKKAEKLNTLFSLSYWKRFFVGAIEKPFLLFVCENDEVAVAVSELLNASTELTDYRLTTDARMQNDLSSPKAILKYSEEKKSLVGVKAVIFKEGEANE